MRSSTIAVVQAALITVSLALGHATAAADEHRAEQSDPASVVVEAKLGEAMFPGHTVDLHFSVVNRSGERIRFTSVATGRVLSSDEAACPAANITVRRQVDLSLHVPSEATVAASLLDAVTLSATAPDGCQGKSFTIGLLLR
jgi:hypothetical protein